MFDADGFEWPDDDDVDPAVLDDLPSLPDELAWLSGDLDQGLEDLCAAPPTAATHRALALIGAGPLSARQRLLHAAAWDRQHHAVGATAMTAQVEATRPSGCSGWTADQELLDTELGLLLLRSDRQMTAELFFARRVSTALPVMTAAWHGGDVNAAHVRALEELTALLHLEDAQTIDASVSHRAATMTVTAFRRIVRQAIADLDPDPIATREKAKRQAGAKWWPGEHGMGTLGLTMPAAEGIACLQALNTQANKLHRDGDTRTHGQRQIDVVLAALLGQPTPGQGSSPSPPNRAGARIVATIDLASLLGMQEHPGELAGHGPVPAQEIRDLLTRPGTVLHRLVYDPVTGNVTDYSVRGYRPDSALTELLRVRDVTCRAPGCTRNAVYCEAEHCQPYDHEHPDQGGETSCENCGLTCRKHHNLKTHAGFSYRRPDPATGETVWTTPAGFTYTQQAASYTPTGRDTGDTIREQRPPPRESSPPADDDPPF